MRTFMIAAASVAVLTLSPTAFAQKADHGTADEAKAMLVKAVAAVHADKTKALDMFNKGRISGPGPLCFLRQYKRWQDRCPRQSQCETIAWNGC